MGSNSDFLLVGVLLRNADIKLVISVLQVKSFIGNELLAYLYSSTDQVRAF